MEELNFKWPIIGHQKIKKILQTGLNNKSLAHAYIFHGPEKLGKTLTAKTLAKTLLCENYNRFLLQTDQTASLKNQNLPCGECEFCQQFDKRIHADVFWVEREINEKTGEKKTAITVTQMRELQDKISKHSFLNSYKIVIIPEAHYLNKEASNSLLKTLEEPTARTVLILITPSKDLLLSTIVSRSQILKFLPITKNEIYDYLIKQGADRSQAKELSSLAQGRPTVAMNYFSSSEALLKAKEKTAQLAELFEKTVPEKFLFVDQLIIANKESSILIKVLNDFTALVRDLLMLESYNEQLLANIYLQSDLEKIAPKLTTTKLIELLKKIEQTKIYLKQNINPKLALENLILKI